MYSVVLPWKAFSLNMAIVEQQMALMAGANYLGNTSNTELTLWFEEDPSQSVRNEIAAYWGALTVMSDEATQYASNAEIQAAIAQLKVDILTKEWADMSVAERKVATNQIPTLAELDLY